ncbi:MAG: hypothetical protein AAFO67_06700, partial [Planctomycetota bacterium]
LQYCDLGDLQDRIGITPEQAQALQNWSRGSDDLHLTDLQIQSLSSLAGGSTQSQGQEQNQNAANVNQLDLEEEQILAVISECTLFPSYEKRPGPININTVSESLLIALFRSRQLEETDAQQLIFMRNAMAEGVTDLAQTVDESMGNSGPTGQLANQTRQWLLRSLDTRSNVFRISSIGTSEVSGLEQEIICLVDRSTIPVRIIEYREP